MKYLSVRRVLALALCLCLAVTLLTVFSPTRSAHAATAKPATCYNLYMGLGFTWGAGDYVTNTTCRGASLKLIYQTDANFVLTINGAAKWASGNTWKCDAPDYAEFQPDGNLVAYCDFAGARIASWASGTEGKSASALVLQDDGNLVIYNSSGKPIWASHTSGH